MAKSLQLALRMACCQRLGIPMNPTALGSPRKWADFLCKTPGQARFTLRLTWSGFQTKCSWKQSQSTGSAPSSQQSGNMTWCGRMQRCEGGKWYQASFWWMWLAKGTLLLENLQNLEHLNLFCWKAIYQPWVHHRYSASTINDHHLDGTSISHQPSISHLDFSPNFRFIWPSISTITMNCRHLSSIYHS